MMSIMRQSAAVAIVGVCAISFLAGTQFSPRPADSAPRSEPDGPSLGDPTKDPPAGVDLRGVLNASRISSASFSLKDTLVIYAGDCVGCSLSQVQKSKLPTSLFPEIVLVFRSPAAEVQRLAKEFSGIGLVADSGGKVASILNPRWNARWYIVRDGRLVKAQGGPKDADWTRPS